MPNPFLSDKIEPGRGIIHLALLPPKTPCLKTSSYQYPLKLVSPAPTQLYDEDYSLVHTVYLLTYGGGLVAGDVISLSVTVEPTTKLVLLTQGSTKLFKSPRKDILSKQCMTVHLHPGSGLCYLPDPVQPFERSCFDQQQIYHILTSPNAESSHGSLCSLDWVSNGRPANGENWSFHRYGSCNEIYLQTPAGLRKLLLRDSIFLDDQVIDGDVASRMHDLAVFGTLIIHGPLFTALGKFFMDEFKSLPRIGGRKWDSGSDSGDECIDATTLRRAARQRQEIADGLLWSAASARGCVVVKFGARAVESGRNWLRNMLDNEGTIAKTFGERALLCLR